MEARRSPSFTPRRVFGSALCVILVGVALHFAYRWSGRSPVAGIFASVNESTWQHLKLAFWPMLLIAPVQWVVYGRPSGWLPATAVRTLTAPLLIIALFYGYTALLGTHALPLDLTVYAVSVLGGEVLGHLVMDRAFPRWVRVAAGSAILAVAAAMATFTFLPPDWFLFEPPG